MSYLYESVSKAGDYRNYLKNVLVVLKCLNPADAGLNIQVCAAWIMDAYSVLNVLQLLCLIFSMYSFSNYTFLLTMSKQYSVVLQLHQDELLI